MVNNFILYCNYSEIFTICNFSKNQKGSKHYALEKKIKSGSSYIYSLVLLIKKTHFLNINLKDIYCSYGTLKIRAPSCTIF